MTANRRDPSRIAAVAAAPRTATGFTLIELMVAMTVGMIILLALSTLFLNTSRTNTELAKTNGLIENGRFAIQLLQSDLVHAGFWDQHVPSFDNFSFTAEPPSADIPGTVPAPCASWPADAAARVTLRTQWTTIPVQAYDATPAGCTMAGRKTGTDVLLVRHAETCAAGQPGCETLSAGRIYFQSSQCATDPSTYALDVLAGTSAADIAASGFTLRRGSCGATVADLRRLVSNVYFIRDGAVPTLMRTRFDGSAFVTEALIEGIEEFRVELGIDNRAFNGDPVNYAQAIAWANPAAMRSPTNRGDGSPDEYVRCTAAAPCTAAQLVNTTVVKLFVLTRSVEPTAGYTDPKTYCLATRDATGNCPADAVVSPGGNFKRHLFTTTVRLNNISGRRETPL